MAYRVEGDDIIIDGWEKGIANDPFSGIADMRNINIDSNPKLASIAPKPFNQNAFSVSSTNVTVNSGTDFITPTSSINNTYFDGTSSAVGLVVEFSVSGAGVLPTGITAGTRYYVISQSGTSWKIASTYQNFLNGTAVDITTNGTAPITVSVVRMGVPVDTKTDPASPNNSYLVDINGDIWTGYTPVTGSRQWVLIKSSTLTASASYSIGIYRGWLFRFRNQYIDVLDISGYNTGISKGVWYDAWKTIATAMPHPTFVGSDDAMYWGDREVKTTTSASDSGSGYIGSLRYNPRADYSTGTATFTNGSATVTGTSTVWTAAMVGQYIVTRNATGNNVYYQITARASDTSITIETTYSGATVTGKYLISEGNLFRDTNNPTTSVQYTYNDKALDIPNGEYPTSLNELGTNLMVGTNTDKVYPWDRISDSFGLPLTCPEYYIDKMVNINNILYIFSGAYGRAYKTNGVRVAEAFEIPPHILSRSTRDKTSKFFYWGDVKSSGDDIFFGVTSDDYMTLMKYNTKTDVLTTEQDALAITGSTATDAVISSVSFYYDTTFSFFTTNGYAKKTRFGYRFIASTGLSGSNLVYQYQVLLDSNGDQGLYGNYEPFIITDCIPIGTNYRSRTFQQIELKLAQPMTNSAESVKLQYRTSKNGGQSNFTDIGSMDYDSARSSAISELFTTNIENVEWVQFKILFKGNTSNNLSTTSSRVQLREIRIR